MNSQFLRSCCYSKLLFWLEHSAQVWLQLIKLFAMNLEAKISCDKQLLQRGEMLEKTCPLILKSSQAQQTGCCSRSRWCP